MQAIETDDRRIAAKALPALWEQLTLAQKFAVAELQRYGYQLQFVRHIPTGQLAVLDFAGKLAAIDSNGQIDTAPSLVIRH